MQIWLGPLLDDDDLQWSAEDNRSKGDFKSSVTCAKVHASGQLARPTGSGCLVSMTTVCALANMIGYCPTVER